MQALSGEVARGEVETRREYQAELRTIIDLAASGLKGRDPAKRRREAIALLALLAGGVSIARAMEDPALSDEIADAVRSVADKLVGGRAS